MTRLYIADMAESVDAQVANATTNKLSEEQRKKNMLHMQMEALGMTRRENYSTTEFRENRREFVPLYRIQRRIEQEGTEENLAVQGNTSAQLNAWNTAWRRLKDDGAVTEELKEVNEGLGQTHVCSLAFSFQVGYG